LKALLRLAGPIVGAQVGFMAMGVVDTVVAGPLGAAPLAALAVGNIAFFTIFVGAHGIVLSLDAFIAQAIGAGRQDDAARGMVQGLWLAAAMTPPAIGVMLLVPWILGRSGYTPEQVDAIRGYLIPLLPGVLPGLIFTAFRSGFAAAQRPNPPLLVVLVANVLHAALDIGLAEGRFGLPALGVSGIAWSTTISRFLMVAALAPYWALHPSMAALRTREWSPQPPILKRLLGIGLPIGAVLVAEVGAFGAVGVLMGLKGEAPLAGHQVALNATALLFMVPLGIGAAASVRCGQARGSGDPLAVRRAGWTALSVGTAYAIVSGVFLVLCSGPITSAYRVPDDVRPFAMSFLAIAAGFQWGDCTQAVGNGVLRGLGETRAPLLFGLLGYAVLALPLGYLGSFVLSDDPDWLWWGLAVGLGTVAVADVAWFRRVVRRLPAAPPST
jgi:MATE family multidrug resistance protein